MHHDVVRIEKYCDATYNNKTVYYYNEGTSQVAWPMGYLKDGPFYSSDKKPVEVTPDGNATCENAHDNQKQSAVPITSDTPPSIKMGEYNSNANPTLEVINLTEHIRYLEPFYKAMKI